MATTPPSQAYTKAQVGVPQSPPYCLLGNFYIKNRIYADRCPSKEEVLPCQVLDIIRSIAAEAMGAEVTAEVPLMSAGLDSLTAVELRNGVSTRFGISLPATFSFDYPALQVTLCMW